MGQSIAQNTSEVWPKTALRRLASERFASRRYSVRNRAAGKAAPQGLSSADLPLPEPIIAAGWPALSLRRFARGVKRLPSPGRSG